MTYLEWYGEFGAKHKNIVDKLLKKEYTQAEIIEYFRFENMLKNEPSFCLLYKENKKCHDIPDLNCYLCACPNFRFNDSGLHKEDSVTTYSVCSIGSGSNFRHENSIHLDCSSCTVPHHKNYIENNFDVEWSNIMKYCQI